MELNNKTAIITGGAGGIGKAIAEKYLAEGAKVVLWDHSLQALERAQGELNHPELKIIQVDVTQEESIQKGFSEILKSWETVDILVNNAGITRDSMAHKMSLEQWNKVIEVNLTGVFLCGTALIKKMRKWEKGVILNTSSIVAEFGNIGQSNYAASKAGVISLTKTWARECGGKNIRVNAVSPGFTHTEMLSTVPEKIIKDLETKTPLGRLGQPKDLAEIFSFLASDRASFITGQVIGVDGGLTL